MSKRAAESALWEQHRDTIHKLYILEDRPLKDVMAHMAKYHYFDRKKAQYERVFLLWRWRKNLKASEWRFVHSRIAQRAADGKNSDLYVDGMIVPREKVQKETTRHINGTALEYVQQNIWGQANPSTPPGITVSSPFSSQKALPEKETQIPLAKNSMDMDTWPSPPVIYSQTGTMLHSTSMPQMSPREACEGLTDAYRAVFAQFLDLSSAINARLLRDEDNEVVNVVRLEKEQSGSEDIEELCNMLEAYKELYNVMVQIAGRLKNVELLLEGQQADHRRTFSRYGL